ncbi:hypothetical protein BGW36DRAFT_387784 [Talaromyces proteolyticus]|uniref:Apple domain-containing protein n=1 Tax=Talaromyces proteolyticus TaxID=1131652 RepID=A0AAD4KLD3_9EURO|nr:uncharacterized protein BGW36DRAFT_387784 [Talaromyces proteolyticus]KAH8691152.1 hypothetical protein BGW36DRAFT_387784 [Talaromyces proteolyticus]
MKVACFWVSIALSVPRALAATSTTSTAAAPTCTSSLITSLCSYPEPGPDFAVASDGKAFCWDYCNDHSPCNFVIFSAGNPYTGTGTCWLYPGETFDASKGSSKCDNPSLSVYSKPQCAGGSATTTAGACAATATPSAVASVCGYPTPSDGCFDSCTASTGASDCLSQCAKADSCSYVVFNPHNPSNSPYAPGSCWMYPNGTFNPESVTACTGAPEQFVYNNSCPKPSPSSSSVSSSATEHSGTATVGATPGSTTSAAPGSNGKTAGNTTDLTATNNNSAPAGLSLSNPLAIGVAILAWQAL